MKKKLLSIILSIFLIIPCFTFVGCGDKPETPHEHNWQAAWSKNATEHWHACSGCDETKDKNNHSGNPCNICGYTAGSSEGEEDSLPVVSSVRDLEVITYDTGVDGVFTLVLLPDGKNMMIDSGNEGFDTQMLIEDELKYEYIISTIDYFVLTNTSAVRTAQAKYVLTDSLLEVEVKNLYTPREINNSAPTCYEEAIANAPATCNVVEVGESNCDITYSFKDAQNNTYTYTIDFMLPVATADCNDEFDASIAISIEYAGKTILISGDATEKTIHGYYDKYNGQKDVDVLITSYLSAYPNAIVNSKANGKDYLECISLEEGDYAIVSPTSTSTNIGSLKNMLIDTCGAGLEYVFLLTESNASISSISITSQGVISVTAE